MRETVASTWVYQLVIIFILIFVAFLVMSLSYSKTYKTKNELINIIERSEGVNTRSVQIMNNYLKSVSYATKGNCPVGESWMGATSLSNTADFKKTVNGTKYYYCINKKWNNDSLNKKSITSKSGKNTITYVKSKMFYQIKIFYHFNLPVLGDFFTFSIGGTTNDIFTGSDMFSK